jgi:hypothetical protein
MGLTGTVDMGGTWYDPSNIALGGNIDTAANIPGSFNYDYIVGNGVCPDDTSTVLVIVDGTCDFTAGIEALSGELSIYPNPSSDIVTIDNGLGLAIDRIELLDMSGRVVYAVAKGNFTNASPQLNLSTLTTGVYLLKLQAGNQTFTERLIKQ